MHNEKKNLESNFKNILMEASLRKSVANKATKRFD